MTAHGPDVVPQAPLSALPDEALVARARLRDTAAFEILVGRHEEQVYRLARRFMHSEADAQEVSQEAFLSAWRNLDKFEGQSQFGSWLYRVATNAALMALRTQRRRPAVPIEELAAGTLDRVAASADWESGPSPGSRSDWSRRPDDQFASVELRRRIQSAVDDLPEAQRAVFLVRDVDGLSTEDTGALLGVPVATVKTRLHRARLSLRKAIGDHFDGG